MERDQAAQVIVIGERIAVALERLVELVEVDRAREATVVPTAIGTIEVDADQLAEAIRTALENYTMRP
jgi:hypothetical protein